MQCDEKQIKSHYKEEDVPHTDKSTKRRQRLEDKKSSKGLRGKVSQIIFIVYLY